MNKDKSLFRLGITGTIIAAVCCFTPFLVIVFGALGLSAFLAYLDLILLPALGIFIAITTFAVYKKKAPKIQDGSERNGNE